MNDSLYIGATGLRAQQLNVDTISNNLANVNTPGFKKSRLSFDDAMYREVLRANGAPGDAANLQRVGGGVTVGGVNRVFAGGELKKTDDPYDIAVSGAGFFELTRADGSTAYARTAHLKVNDEGLLASADGSLLAALVRVPEDARGLRIGRDGVISATFGDDTPPQEIGTLELVQFANTAALQPVGDGLYTADDGAGTVSRALPGQDGSGVMVQGYQEASNVSLVDEMVGLMVAQRAYEVSAKVVQASDDMLAITNNLRR
ncbi:MAG: flagellar basal-body rod protein FlgG [Aquabacterium sp.]|jgi:flagellar basal-body rod protein FlgG|nr:MAG: flagellar basal-body rod protein FlgG [Aquabacterium sp.]